MNLSGGQWPLYGLALVAFIILAAILFWVARRMLTRSVTLSGEGAQRGKRSRLGVIDSFEIDRRRRLLLLRRDVSAIQ